MDSIPICFETSRSNPAQRRGDARHHHRDEAAHGHDRGRDHRDRAQHVEPPPVATPQHLPHDGPMAEITGNKRIPNTVTTT